MGTVRKLAYVCLGKRNSSAICLFRVKSGSLHSPQSITRFERGMVWQFAVSRACWIVSELRQVDQRCGLPAGFAVLGHDVGEDAAAHVELGVRRMKRRWVAATSRPARIGHVLVEMALVAERPDIELKTLQLHAFLVSDVIQDQGGEIRLPVLGHSR